MYVGHVAVALMGKGVRPQIPLWVLLLASHGPDWLVIIGVLTGHSATRVELLSETAYSFILFALPLALLYFVASRDWRSSLIVWAVCASHQVLDFVTGSKALIPNGRLVGLGWYHRPLRDFVAESMLVFVAALLYRRTVAREPSKAGILVITFSALILSQLALDIYLASSVRNGWLAHEVHTGGLFP